MTEEPITAAQGHIDALNARSYTIRNNDHVESLRLAEEAIRLATAAGYANGQAQGHCNAGFGYIQQSKFDRAITHLDSAHELFTGTGNDDGIASVLYNFGIIFLRLGDMNQALHNQFKSLAFREKTGNKTGTGICLFQIAFIQHQFRQFDSAIEHAQKGLACCTESGDIHGIAALHMVIGMCYSEKGEKETAIAHFRQSIGLRKKINDPKGHGTVLYALGNHYIRNREPWLAQNYLSEALAICDEHLDKPAMTRVRISLCELHILQQLFEQAEKYILQALELVNASGLKSLLPDVFKNAAGLYEKTGRHLEALEAYKNYLQAKEEVYNADAAIRVKHNDLLRKMETASMEAEINHLKNVALKKAYDEIEQKNKDITDSIYYAKRIQNALLSNDALLEKNLPAHFVLFRPKDIVSGDFYWATVKDEAFYLAVCDSTGHGVPGAFMSLLNTTLLNEAINEKNICRPDEVLNYVRQKLISYIAQDGAQDGMDGILLRLEKDDAGIRITYAAANNAPLLVSGGITRELPCDKMPVGKSSFDSGFSVHEIALQPGESLYLCTDGYADQFGGPECKKFKKRRLRELLAGIAADMPGEQLYKLEDSFLSWKGDLEQIDDVCIVGIKA